MKQLSLKQRELVSSLGKQLGSISGIKAVVLGGSHARGWAQRGSDIDIGILYSEAEPSRLRSFAIWRSASTTPKRADGRFHRGC